MGSLQSLYPQKTSVDHLQQLQVSSTDGRQNPDKDRNTEATTRKVFIMDEIINGLAQLSNDIKELKELTRLILKSRQHLFNECWLDNQDIALALHLSKRSLQTLRDNGILPYSRIHNKFYYKVSDIKALLESTYLRNFKSKTNVKQENHIKPNE